MFENKEYQDKMIALKAQTKRQEELLNLQDEFMGIQDRFFNVQKVMDQWIEEGQTALHAGNVDQAFVEVNRVQGDYQYLQERVQHFEGIQNFFHHETVIERMDKYLRDHQSMIQTRKKQVVEVLAKHKKKRDEQVSLRVREVQQGLKNLKEAGIKVVDSIEY
jgi:hypothetical protein